MKPLSMTTEKQHFPEELTSGGVHFQITQLEM